MAHMVGLEHPANTPLHRKLMAGKMNQIIRNIAGHKAQQEPGSLETQGPD